VPSLYGITWNAARDALAALGLRIVQGADYPVTDPALVGLVIAQDPDEGTLLEANGEVTVRLGVLAGGG
jgi:beta-lactam-binding protein with PASTA domain